MSATFTVSGDCAGTASQTDTPTSASTFEGHGALALTDTATMTLTNCTINGSSTSTSTTTVYVDSAYSPLGHSEPGSEYGVYLSAATPLPASAKVGDGGSIGTETLYEDSSKTTPTGTDVLSYVLEADTTASTAIVNFITRSYDNANALQLTVQNRYRIDANGTLTPVSSDYQEAGSNGTHLVLTRP